MDDVYTIWLFLTCSEGFGAFPPELLRWCSSLSVFLEPGSEHLGREVVTVGRHLPQRRGLIDNLREHVKRKVRVPQNRQINIDMTTEKFLPADREDASSSVSTGGTHWACAVACSSCSTRLPWRWVGRLAPPRVPCGFLCQGGLNLHHKHFALYICFFLLIVFWVLIT